MPKDAITDMLSDMWKYTKKQLTIDFMFNKLYFHFMFIAIL